MQLDLVTTVILFNSYFLSIFLIQNKEGEV